MRTIETRGWSLLPLLQGVTQKDWRTYSFLEQEFINLAQPTVWESALGTRPSESRLSILREGRFALVKFPADLPLILYDHEAQGERENVAEDHTYQGELARLCGLMLRHRMQNMDHTLSLVTITGDDPYHVQKHPLD